MIRFFNYPLSSILSRSAAFVPSINSPQHCRKPPLFLRSRTIVDCSPVLRSVRIKCYSSKRKSAKSKKGEKKVGEEEEARGETEMGDEKDGVYVVRKGDLVGVYRSLKECQAQVGSTIFDTPASVYKGSLLPKETEEYLASRGLQNALYTIKASDLKEGIFGTLVPCALQDSASSKGSVVGRDLSLKRPHEAVASEDAGIVRSLGDPAGPLGKHTKLLADTRTCIIEFDGAAKGNPGPAGAGVVLRTGDGSLICKLRQGLGTATNNAAEYRAVILGLKHAHEKGYTNISVKGDSKLVCLQLQGMWKVKHENMSLLHAEAKNLKDKFLDFQINHVLREFNSEADAQANLAVSLPDGQVQVDYL